MKLQIHLRLLRYWTLIAGLWTTAAWAHKPSDSYLTFRTDHSQLIGEWHLALRDLEEAVGLDSNEDGVITWGELRAAEQAITSYAFGRLTIRDGHDAGRLRPMDFLVDTHTDGAYAVLRFVVENVRPEGEWDVKYDAFFDLDRTHRGLVRIQRTANDQLFVLGPESRLCHIAAGELRPRFSATILRDGVWHIWTGYDHLLFLLALLLPGALTRSGPRWLAQGRLPAVRDVLKTVTAFTLAHSITLSLAAFNLVHLPARLVECAIAVSVIVAAANNVVNVLRVPGWLLAFCFGLLHGFGFANALADLGLHGIRLAPALLTFNCGVELGQLAIVAGILPLILAVRNRPFYVARLVPFGSVGIAVVAAVWLAERSFDFKCLPF